MEMRLSEDTAYALTTGGGKPGQGYPCVLYANDHGRSRLSGGEHNESEKLEQPAAGGSRAQPDERQQELSCVPGQRDRLPEWDAYGRGYAHPASEAGRRGLPELHAERGDRRPYRVSGVDPYNGAETGEVAVSLTTKNDGTHSGPVLVLAFMGGQGAKARSIALCADGTTPTLKSAPSGGNTVPDICYRRTDE